MKRIANVMVTTLFVATLMCSFADAVHSADYREAEIWKHNLWVNDSRIACYDVSGNKRDMITYAGSIYIPAKTFGEILGCSIDTAGNVIILSTEDTAAKTIYGNGHHSNIAGSKAKADGTLINVKQCPDVSIIYNGKTVHFSTPNGASLSPIIYDQVLYLPVRGISLISDMEVSYVGPTGPALETVYVRVPLSESEINSIQGFIYSSTEFYHTISKEFCTLWNRPSEYSNITADLNKIRQQISSFLKTPNPNEKFCGYTYLQIMQQCQELYEELANIERLFTQGATSLEVYDMEGREITRTVESIRHYLYSLENSLERQGYVMSDNSYFQE